MESTGNPVILMISILFPSSDYYYFPQKFLFSPQSPRTGDSAIEISIKANRHLELFFGFALDIRGNSHQTSPLRALQTNHIQRRATRAAG